MRRLTRILVESTSRSCAALDASIAAAHSAPSRSYGWKWTLFIVAVAVYIADTYTLIALLASNRWAGQILQSEAAQSDSKSSNVLEVPFKVRPRELPAFVKVDVASLTLR